MRKPNPIQLNPTIDRSRVKVVDAKLKKGVHVGLFVKELPRGDESCAFELNVTLSIRGGKLLIPLGDVIEINSLPKNKYLSLREAASPGGLVYKLACYYAQDAKVNIDFDTSKPEKVGVTVELRSRRYESEVTLSRKTLLPYLEEPRL